MNNSKPYFWLLWLVCFIGMIGETMVSTFVSNREIVGSNPCTTFIRKLQILIV